MEEGLPLAALEHMCGFAAAVEVRKPFTVFGVGEVAPGPIVEFVEPIQIFFVAGDFVGIQASDDRFVMHPPEFHIVLQFQMRLAEYVHKVENAAELFIQPKLSVASMILSTSA